MIDKSISVPDTYDYSLRFPLEKLRKGGSVRRVSLRHLKETDGGIVCAEGLYLRMTVNAELTRLFCADDDLFFYSAPAKRTFQMGKMIERHAVDNVRRIFDCTDADGNGETIMLTDGGLYRLTENSQEQIASFGGTCCALHYERVFVGNGTRLYYSEPLSYDDWSDFSTQAAGYIDFPSPLGNILEIVSFGDKLFLFRENGITSLTAYADVLNFRAGAVPCGAGKIAADSVVSCGGEIYFFGTHGLHVFNGSSCDRVRGADDDGIDFSAPVTACAFDGVYFASVQMKDGSRALYSYDPVLARGRYLSYDCDCVAAGDRVWFNLGSDLCRLSGTAFPRSGECALELSFFAGDTKAGEKFAEAVTVDGAGNFTLELVSDVGETVSLQAAGGRRAVLPRALRGEGFCLKVIPEDEGATITAVNIRMRRDSLYDD